MNKEHEQELIEIAAKVTVEELVKDLGAETLRACLFADIPEGLAGNLIVPSPEEDSNYALHVQDEEVHISHGPLGPYRVPIKTALGWIEESEQTA